MEHSPAVIAAVFNCVKNKIGSRKAHQQLSAEHKAKHHSLECSEVESHLKRFKKLELPRPAKGVAIPFFFLLRAASIHFDQRARTRAAGQGRLV